MIKSTVYLTFSLILLFQIGSCGPPSSEVDQEPTPPPSETREHVRPNRPDTMPKLTSIQRAAFGALNSFQRYAGTGERIYSSFAGSGEQCSTPDSVFTISQEEFATSLRKLLTEYATTMQEDEWSELVDAAVLADEEYTVHWCFDGTTGRDRHKGHWTLSHVLDRRDVVLIW